jgi:hypothetical protein
MHPRGMKVLVLESHLGASRTASALLEGAGHTVVRCIGEHGSPCRELDDDGECPLDGDHVSVAVVAHAGGPLAPGEHGALCAARRRVPLVSTGYLGGETPLGALAVASGADLVARWVVAARDGDRHAGAIRRDLVRLGVIRADELGNGAPLQITVERSPRRVALILRIPDGDEREASIVKAASEALRRFDPNVPVIDVRVTR